MKLRTRKRTAVEKATDKAKNATIKELKKDKQEVKEKARKDKKEIRQDARVEKSEIRKSGVKGKAKRDAVKDINEDKRKDVNDINSIKKIDVAPIKEELKVERKKTRLALNIILPVKTANVNLLRNDLSDIEFLDSSGTLRHIEIKDAFDVLNLVYQRSIEMAEAGLAYLNPFVVLAQRPSWINNWNNDALLVRWFGLINKVGDASAVHNKLNSVVTRLNKKMTIRLHPQRDMKYSDEGTGGTTAQNNGTFFEPRTFKVFPWLFESARNADRSLNIENMASTFIHEMVHLTVFDQKLEGETVYGEELALQLAIDRPNKARKSPENFSFFCLELM